MSGHDAPVNGLNPTAGRVALSFGKDKFDAYPTQHSLPDFTALAEFVCEHRATERGKLYFAAPFSSNGDGKHHRCKDDAMPRAWLPLDLDYIKDRETLTELLLAAQRWQHFAYTTASHTVEKPRMRAVFSLSRAVSRDEGIRCGLAFQREWLAVAGLPDVAVKFDECVYRGEQPCFGPLAQAEIYPRDCQITGAVLDVEHLLANAPEIASSVTAVDRAGGIIDTDPRVQHLIDAGYVLKVKTATGKLAIRCPNESAHSSATSPTATVVLLPHFNGVPTAVIKCLHTSCSGLTQADFWRLAKYIEAPKTSADELLQGDAAGLATQELARIAALPDIQYERERKTSAKNMGVRAVALDKIVQKIREETAKSAKLGEMFGEIEPWAQPVDGAALLTDLHATFVRFVALPKYAAVTLALWAVLTFVHDAFKFSPILLLRSATKRCGKSTLVGLLAQLVHRPMAASNLTPAVIFRVIEAHRPTLLIDEADSFLELSEEMRGVLNSGHQRETARVYRIEEVRGTRETVGFSTWAPKLLAMIGQPPATILDRSISIKMQRKLRGEKIEKRRHATVDVEGMRARCQRWAVDHGLALEESRPNIPQELNDRQADSWEPLLAIADRAGVEWGRLAREAAVGMAAGDAADLDEAELNEELLRDCREIFDELAARKKLDNSVEADRIASEDLTERLLGLAERPWGEANRGRPITQNWLGRRLSTFGIVSSAVRFADGRNLRGFKLEQFADAWARYISPSPP